jgi:hypothetical protein
MFVFIVVAVVAVVADDDESFFNTFIVVAVVAVVADDDESFFNTFIVVAVVAVVADDDESFFNTFIVVAVVADDDESFFNTFIVVAVVDDWSFFNSPAFTLFWDLDLDLFFAIWKRKLFFNVVINSDSIEKKENTYFSRNLFIFRWRRIEQQQRNLSKRLLKTTFNFSCTFHFS